MKGGGSRVDNLVDTYRESSSYTVLSTCPPRTYSGCGKERRILIGPW